MLRKVPLMDDLNFVISFIDDTFKVYASEAERNGSFWDQSLGSAHW